jgi:hypothetical protein
MVEVRVSLRNVMMSVCIVSALAGTARADDENVVGRLSSNGGLSSSTAKKLVSKVNVRMAKAADATSSANDPMRAAVSLALFQAPQPPNSMAAAKVRLRLYAGLNEWALEAIFAPQPGVVAGCVREVGASQSECEALVAAAARSSVAQIRSIAGGSAPAMAGGAPAGGYGGQQPAAAGGGRFGRFGSGYQPPPQQYPQQQQQYARPAYPQQYPQQQYARPAYPQQYPQQQQYARPAYPQQYPQQQQQYARPVPQQYPQQQQYARPAAPVAPPPPMVSPQDAQMRKDAYKAQREAYLARQKQQFDERKQKSTALHQQDSSEAPPRPGEQIEAPNRNSNSQSSTVAASAAAAKAAPKPAPAAAAASNDDGPSETVAAKGGNAKPALDNDFLDGLLDDPLAAKKGK